MSGVSQKLLRILDGSPGALGGYQRGQSLVELLLITPLMIIMVAGIIEIGWYANHVLILLEVTRVGARQATLLTGEVGYQSWDNSASIHPIAYKLTTGFTPAKSGLSAFGGTGGADYAPGTWPINAGLSRDCVNTFGFYSQIACSMINSLEPLTVKGRDPSTADILARRIRVSYGPNTSAPYEGYTLQPDEVFLFPDDIVISVFSLQAVNNAIQADKDKLKNEPNTYARTYDFGGRFPRGYQVLVVGRYPTNANECNVTFTPNVAGSLAADENYMKRILTLGAVDEEYKTSTNAFKAQMTAPGTVLGAFRVMSYNAGDSTTYRWRDPFDYFSFDYKRTEDPSAVGRFFELAGIDVKAPNVEKAEFQRGFVWTGQHYVHEMINPTTREQLFCIGSEWSDQRVQDMMNSPSFVRKGIPANPDGAWQAANAQAYKDWQDRAKFLPSQGAVLVEMFWRHDILLDFPLMTPIIRLMEGAGGPYNIVISVWAAFPLPSAEPNMNFGFPPK